MQNLQTAVPKVELMFTTVGQNQVQDQFENLYLVRYVSSFEGALKLYVEQLDYRYYRLYLDKPNNIKVIDSQGNLEWEFDMSDFLQEMIDNDCPSRLRVTIPLALTTSWE